MSNPTPQTFSTAARIYEHFAPRFLAGCELTKPVTVTIERIAGETVRDKTTGEIKPVIVAYMKGATRGVKLTKTLIYDLADTHGLARHICTYEQLIGKRAELYQAKTLSKKDWQIRARPAPAAPPAKTASQPAKATGQQPQDDEHEPEAFSDAQYER